MSAPRIVLFSGGTAARSINIALSRRGADLTRIVPAWDSGGSSKVLRETFGMLPVGDVRQALMTMAFGEGRTGDAVKIFNTRLSSAPGNGEARLEFDYFVCGEHPLLRRLAPDMRAAILKYLNIFADAVPGDFDFGNGSIGNFILTGAFLAHRRDINTAIAEFRGLDRIRGRVWPGSVDSDIELAALLRDGRQVLGQHRVTGLDDEMSGIGIDRVDLRVTAGGRPQANGEVFGPVAEADLIVFGPGSFFTSIMPHFLVDGLAEAITQNRRAPRVFIGNILECAETRGRSLSELVETFLASWRRDGGERRRGLTHLISNRDLFPFAKSVGKFRYLREGPLGDICRVERLTWISGEFEDAWMRGQHDGEEVAAALMKIAAEGRGPDA